MALPLPVLNLETATFECTFGLGCDGLCCYDGRPPVDDAEIDRIESNLDRFLPHLRPDAQKLVKRSGFLEPRRRRFGQRIVRVSGGACVFFNRGCVLHSVGDAEGDKYRYKPTLCALFPLQQDPQDRWFIRQPGYKGEDWPLPCLTPGASRVPARESLRDEIELARRAAQD
jgi:hypothetical protein